jgi:hypothetical protein
LLLLAKLLLSKLLLCLAAEALLTIDQVGELCFVLGLFSLLRSRTPLRYGDGYSDEGGQANQ